MLFCIPTIYLCHGWNREIIITILITFLSSGNEMPCNVSSTQSILMSFALCIITLITWSPKMKELFFLTQFVNLFECSTWSWPVWMGVGAKREQLFFIKGRSKVLIASSSQNFLKSTQNDKGKKRNVIQQIIKKAQEVQCRRNYVCNKNLRKPFLCLSPLQTMDMSCAPWIKA